eukprot:TRINITY_DN3307_c1_g2_i4.p1 TRINITY_DN3307_c1_g2~~TRINITY_DN3307_c1_g2_i4.p1  ORF type:complete len:431 (+),score=82.79 TRINITY_DN3307_c1_g2_i4:449-1741(+)
MESEKENVEEKTKDLNEIETFFEVRSIVNVGDKIHEISGFSNKIHCIDFSNDGSIFVVCVYNNKENESIMIFDSETYTKIHNIKVDRPWYCCFSADNLYLAICDDSLKVHIHRNDRSKNFEWIQTLDADTETYSLCFSKTDSNILFCGSTSGMLTKFDIQNGEKLNSCKPVNDQFIWRIDVNPENTLLAAGSGDNNLYVVDMESFNLAWSVSNHTSCICCVQFSHSGEFLISSSEDGHVHMYSVATQELIHSMDIITEVGDNENIFIEYVKFFSKDRQILALTRGKFFIIDVATFKITQVIDANLELNYVGVGISKDETQILVGRTNDCALDVYATNLFANNGLEQEIDQLISFSRKYNGGVILAAKKYEYFHTNFIRTLVNAGLVVRQEEFDDIINLVWDLVEWNGQNNGNLEDFMQLDTSDDEITDDD